MNAVPQSYLGVWQRTLLTTSCGLQDTTTEVYWLQNEFLFADIRVPQNAHATSLTRALQAGFAGVTEVEDDICQWHRIIDFQPPSARDDVGRMRFIAPDYLQEDALDASYHEVWERLPESVGRNQGVWLTSVEGRQGCLVLAGDYFLFAASLAQPLPLGESLSALLEAGASESILDFELSFGRHHGGETPWQIELSTLPARSGQRLLPDEANPDQLLESLTAEVLANLGAVPPSEPWHLSLLPSMEQTR